MKRSNSHNRLVMFPLFALLLAIAACALFQSQSPTPSPNTPSVNTRPTSTAHSPSSQAFAAPSAYPSLTPALPSAAPRLDSSAYGKLVFACQGSDVDVCTASPDDWEITYLTTQDSIDIDPSWSPDGTMIAFASDRASRQVGGFDIYILDLASNSIDQVTSGPGYDIRPSWSPDGTRLAFLREGEGAFVLTLADNQLSLVPSTDGSTTSVQWSPVANQVAFLAQDEGASVLKVTDLSTGSLTTVPGVQAQGSRLGWHPEGSSIAFTARGDCKLWLVDLHDGHQVPLTSGPGCDRDPAWSFDGQYLVFSSNRDTSSDLYLLDVPVRLIARLTTEALADAPSWLFHPSAQ
jgi:Tol biopolymer transport system component